MKSRITIEVDFENNNSPIIQILQSASDDVRDKLVKSFTEQLGGSSWCKIRWVAEVDSQFSKIIISPISEADFRKNAAVMISQLELNEKFSGKENDEAYRKVYELITNESGIDNETLFHLKENFAIVEKV